MEKGQEGPTPLAAYGVGADAQVVPSSASLGGKSALLLCYEALDKWLDPSKLHFPYLSNRCQRNIYL